MTHAPLSVGEDPLSQPLRADQQRRLFEGKSVAVLLLGEAFRSGAGGRNDTSCTETSINAQKEASISYVDNVLKPLEALGALVEVVLTFSACNTSERTRRLRSILVGWMRPYVKRAWTVRSWSMDDGWRKAYRMLSARVRQRGVEFDYILHGRHDIYIERPITTWPSNFSQMLFEQECRLGCGGGCKCGTIQRKFLECENGVCVKDHLMWTPRKHYALLNELMQLSFSNAGSGYAHRFRMLMLGTGRIHEDETGYLFPPECSREGSFGNAFQTRLMCDQYAAYRPARPRVGLPVALPEALLEREL